MKGKSKELIFSNTELKKSNPNLKKTEEFKQLERRCRSSSLLDTFSPMEIKRTENMSQFKFSILHAIIPKQTNDAIDGVASAQLFAPKKKFISFLELSFRPVEEKWIVNLNCFSHTKFIEYDLSTLLNLINPSLIEEGDRLGQNRRLSVGSLNLDTKQIKLPQAVELEKSQVEAVLMELLKHEGERPSNETWMAKGSLKVMQDILFSNGHTHMPK